MAQPFILMKIKKYLYQLYKVGNFNYGDELSDLESFYDPVKFLETLLGKPLANHHLTWVNSIVTNLNSSVLLKVSGDNLRISAPRGSAKTTIISALLAWIIGHNPAIRIILCAYAEDVALTISVSVKNMIDCDKYRQVFPMVKKSRRWRDRSWVIDREYAGITVPIKDATLYAVGVTGAIASRRADLIVLDDPIRSSKDIANPARRTDMVRWWAEVLEPTLVPGGRCLVLCTRYRHDDIHGTLFLPVNGWQVITQPAIVNDEHGNEVSFWPEYMPLEFLLSKRNNNPVAFASQYQNFPTAEENQLISPQWILRDSVHSYYTDIAIGVDLAGSARTTADYTAYVVVGLTTDKKYHVIGFGRGRFTISQTIKELLILYEQYYSFCDRLSFQLESIAYQVAFTREFKRVTIDRGLRCRVDSVVLKGDKTARLYGVSGLFESLKVIFNQDCNFGILLEELLNFGATAHDDLVDALVYALSKLYTNLNKFEGGSY